MLSLTVVLPFFMVVWGSRPVALGQEPPKPEAVTAPRAFPKKAVEDFERDLRRAERGDRVAQLALAERYLVGTGNTQSLAEGYRWLSLAIGPPIIGREDLPTTKPYTERRDQLLVRRAALGAQLSPAQLAEAKRLTLKGIPVPRLIER